LFAFGLMGVENLRWDVLGEAAKEAKKRALTLMTTRTDEIENTINGYSSFFLQSGYRCPLSGQFQKTRQAGLPAIMPLVDILLATEMSHGVLAGIQDRDRIEGRITFDLAEEDEVFLGMRSNVKCKAGEPILRDSRGIIASYMQGPDSKTKVSEATKNAVLFFFSAPGLSVERLTSAMDFAEESLKSASTLGERVLLQGP